MEVKGTVLNVVADKLTSVQYRDQMLIDSSGCMEYPCRPVRGEENILKYSPLEQCSLERSRGVGI